MKKRLAILSLIGVGLAHGLMTYGDTQNLFLALGSALQFPSLMLFMYAFLRYMQIPLERWDERDQLWSLTERVYELEKEAELREEGGRE